MSDSSKPRDGIVTTVFAWFFAMLYLTYEYTFKPLSKLAYKSPGDKVCGSAATLGAGIGAAVFLVTTGYNAWLYILGPIVAAFVVGGLLYPILHICIVRPVWNYVVVPFFEHIVWRFLRWCGRGLVRLVNFVKKHFKTFCQGTVRATQFTAPGSGWLWKRFSDDTRRSWFRDTFDVVTVILVWSSGIILGYITYKQLIGQYGDVPAIIAGAIVWSFAAWALRGLSKLGGRHFAVLAVSGASIYELSGLLGSLTNLICDQLQQPVNLGWLVGMYAAAFSLFVAYVLPALDGLFTDLLTGLAKFIKQLPELAYEEEKNKPFNGLFAHLANFFFSGVAVYFVVLACGAVGLGWAWTLPIALAVALAAYLTLFITLNHDSTAIVAGLYTSLILAGEVGYYWVKNDWYYSYWGGVGIGVLAFIFTMCILYPILHLIMRAIGANLTSEVPAKKLTELYDWVAKTVTDTARYVDKTLRNNYWSAYDKDAGIYAKRFGHVVNLAAIYMSYQGSSQACGLLGITGYWVWAIIAPSMVLTYLVLGKALGHRYSASVIGVLATLVAAGSVGYFTVDFQSDDVWVRVRAVVAIVSASAATWYFAYPLAYRIVRAVTKWLLNSPVGGVVQSAHEKAWKGFVAVLKAAERAFVAACAWVNRVIVPPVMRFTAGIRKWVGAKWAALCSGIAAAYARLKAFLAPFLAPVKRRLAAVVAKAAAVYRATVETVGRIQARISGKKPTPPAADKDETPSRT